jgi:hypothetical protein
MWESASERGKEKREVIRVKGFQSDYDHIGIVRLIKTRRARFDAEFCAILESRVPEPFRLS